MQSRQPQYCNVCDCIYATKYKLDRHLKTQFHYNNIPLQDRIETPTKSIQCILCQYRTSRQEHYEKHLKTTKHIERVKLESRKETGQDGQ